MKCIACWSLGSVALIAAAGLAAVGFGPAPATPAPAPAAPTAPAGTTYEIDPVHTATVFKISHVGVSNFYGVFNKMTGSFNWDKASPDSFSLNATLDADSVSTGNAARDGHLKKPDFFNAKEQPTITFKSTAVKKTGENTFDVTGDLTLLGKTKPVTAKLTYIGEKDMGPQMGGYQAGFDAAFTIKRSDFGMTYGVAQGVLGDEVSITIGLSGARK